MNILRRLPLSRLLLLCGLVLALGVSLTAIAFALSAGPTPPPAPLGAAVHDAFEQGHSQHLEGVSATITLTNRLLEGANLASGEAGGEDGSGGGLASNPLLSGASGRLWIDGDGHARLELQSEQGDTQLLYDGHALELYDAATNTLYRYQPPAGEDSTSTPAGGPRAGGVPSLGRIEEAISHLRAHADVTGPTPTDVAGQPAYTVRVSPRQSGSLFGGVELSWDADNGVPLRAAVYSSTSSSPVIELAATQISFGAVPPSVFDISPPPDAKIEEVQPATRPPAHPRPLNGRRGHPDVTIHGGGPTAIAVLQTKAQGSQQADAEKALGELPKVSIDGTTASELRTELGTILSFERDGVRYLLAGSVTPAAIEAFARGI